jgi:hypothetical protein
MSYRCDGGKMIQKFKSVNAINRNSFKTLNLINMHKDSIDTHKDGIDMHKDSIDISYSYFNHILGQQLILEATSIFLKIVKVQVIQMRIYTRA